MRWMLLALVLLIVGLHDRLPTLLVAALVTSSVTLVPGFVTQVFRRLRR